VRLAFTIRLVALAIARWRSLRAVATENPNASKSLEFGVGSRSVAGMLTLLRFIVSVLVRRFRRPAVLELENLALRHQLHVLRRQLSYRKPRPG
jgi:hypothetical protein